MSVLYSVVGHFQTHAFCFSDEINTGFNESDDEAYSVGTTVNDLEIHTQSEHAPVGYHDTA